MFYHGKDAQNESETLHDGRKSLLEVQNSNNFEFGCFACLFVCFVALRPKSTAMVMAGRSAHLTTLFFSGKA